MNRKTVQEETVHEGTRMRLWLANTAKGEAMLLLPNGLTRDECQDLHAWMDKIFAELTEPDATP